MRTFGVPLRNNRIVTLEKGTHTLRIDSGKNIAIKLVGASDLLALRDLLNDAYPVDDYTPKERINK